MAIPVKKEILFKPCPVCGEPMIPIGCCGVACPKGHGKLYPRWRNGKNIRRRNG